MESLPPGRRRSRRRTPFSGERPATPPIEILLDLVERLRSRAVDIVGTADVPILCRYEAGYEGFWLYRRLIAAGLRVLVIDPSSLLVNRRAKRAKTDRIDANGDKDAIEACLSRAVCAGKIGLDEARRRIWGDWRRAGAGCDAGK